MQPSIRSLRAIYGAAATFFACAATLSCGSVAGGSESIEGVGQSSAAVTATVNISGQLMDAAGDPIANVTIKLNGSKQLTTTTDFAGRYTFTVPSGGSYSLTATGGLCASWSPQVVNLNNLTADRVVDFLGSGGGCIVAPQQGATSGSLTISGHVISAGHPVAGATIKLNGSAQGIRISDETGAYSFSVNPGSFSLNISGACTSFAQNIVNLNNVNSSRTQNFTGNGCPPAPLTFCPGLDAAFIGENGGPACATITTTSCPDRVNTWDFAIVIDFATAISSDCRFGQWVPPTFPADAVANYLNDLLAFTLELMGCPFQGLQAGPLTDRLVPAVFASHTFTTADLQALSDTYVAAFQQAFSDAGLPPPTAAQVSALRAQLTYLQSKVPNQTAGSNFTFSTCP